MLSEKQNENIIISTDIFDNPIRVQLKTMKGYKMPKNTKSIVKSRIFRNHYKIGMHNIWDIKGKTGKSLRDILIEKNGENKYYTIEDTLLAYRQKIEYSGAMQRLIKHYLKGKNLACFCPVLDKNGNYVHCHADYLLSLANNLTLQEIKDENIKAELRKKP